MAKKRPKINRLTSSFGAIAVSDTAVSDTMERTNSMNGQMRSLNMGLAMVLALSASVTVGPRVSADVDFNFDVQPLLSDRCFRCHGPDGSQRAAGLRLDTQDGSRIRLESGPFAIVPGDPDKSEVVRRIGSKDPDVRMPPPDSKLPSLTESEVKVIEQWIREGAEFTSHWSWQPVGSTPAPDVESSDWPENAIDRFVLARLGEEGIQPAPEASREQLIRRVTFDLTGLPPTLAEIDNYLADSSDRAYETVVNRLLASDPYGERMAVDWLDLARYSDTYGYQTDGGRRVWPWRDWVIGAFNRNLSYDQFITE